MSYLCRIQDVPSRDLVTTVANCEECLRPEFAAKYILVDMEVISNRLEVLRSFKLFPFLLHVVQRHQHCEDGWGLTRNN